MLLYGAGGHAKVIISCITANGDQVRAVFDDDLNKKEISGIAIAGKYNPALFTDESVIIAVGNNETRRLLAQKIRHPFLSIVHPTATIDKSVLIGKGTVVMHGSIIQAGTAIGNHVIINTGAIIDHDCRISDYVHIAPGATLCGNIFVGENTLIGAGSVAVPNIRIGSNCHIAAGSIITHSIPDGSTVRGNPGRIIRSIQ